MTARILGAPAGAVGRLDLISGPERLELLVDVPGLAREDLDVTVHGCQIVVAGRPGQGAAGRGFERRLIFDADVAADDVTASLADGVLRITLHRGARVTRVPVRAPAHRRRHAGERLRRPWQGIRVRRGQDLRRSLRRLAARTAAAEPDREDRMPTRSHTVTPWTSVIDDLERRFASLAPQIPDGW